MEARPSVHRTQDRTGILFADPASVQVHGASRAKGVAALDVHKEWSVGVADLAPHVSRWDFFFHREKKDVTCN